MEEVKIQISRPLIKAPLAFLAGSDRINYDVLYAKSQEVKIDLGKVERKLKKEKNDGRFGDCR